MLKDEFEIYRQIAQSATSFLADKDIEIDQAALYERLLVLERQDTAIRLPQALGEQNVSPELIDEAATSAETAPALLAQTPYEGVPEALTALGERYGLGVISNGRKVAQLLEREIERTIWLVELERFLIRCASSRTTKSNVKWGAVNTSWSRNSSS